MHLKNSLLEFGVILSSSNLRHSQRTRRTFQSEAQCEGVNRHSSLVDKLYKFLKFSYNLVMSDLSISAARADLAKAVLRAKKKPVTISRHGKPVAVLINPSLFEKFVESIEELEDIAAFDEAISDQDPMIPWEQVKKDLGLL